jgi:hypothetical protein
MTVYKIRNKKTGTFSTGRADEGGFYKKNLWSSEGRTWSSENALRQHFSKMPEGRYDRDCEIVTFDVKEILAQPVVDFW